jgi:hypothetical protein
MMVAAMAAAVTKQNKDTKYSWLLLLILSAAASVKSKGGGSAAAALCMSGVALSLNRPTLDMHGDFVGTMAYIASRLM